LQIPTDISVVDLEDYRNNPFNSNSYYFTPYASNPYWTINENSTTIQGNRFYGNVNLNYTFDKNFSTSFQIGGDYRPENIKSYGAKVNYLDGSPQDEYGTIPVVGGVTEISDLDQEVYSNLMINYTGKIGDTWGFNGLLGFNYDERSGQYLQASITNLDIPNFYELSNSSVKPIVDQQNYLRREEAVYASLETSYKDFLYLTITGRNDWTSTLPQGNNSYFYPSVSLSGIVLDTNDYFLKLRAGYAEIGGDTNPYQTESSMVPGFGAIANQVATSPAILLPFGGVNGYEFAQTLGNPDLKPELTNEWEVGLETSLFNKRVNLDAAVYNKTTEGLLFRRPLPTSTGYGFQTSNLLDITNKGIELLLSVNAIQSEDWQWNITATYTKNESNVDSIEDGVDKIQLATNYGVSFNAVVDQPLGVFSTFVPEVNSAGQYVVDNNGYYKVTKDEQIIGTSQRDFVMGFTTKLSYKSISLFAAVDWKQGGEMYSYTRRLSEFTGNGVTTTYNYRNAFIVPNSVTEVLDANGDVIGYEENTTPITQIGQTDWYNTQNNPGIEQTHVIDKTFVRLGSLALTYNVPFKLIKKTGLSNAALSVYGKNLALWTPDGNAYIDPELTTFGDGLLSEQGEFSANPSQSTYGASIKLTF
ncbi:MAG TPA: TonB-dependent receptor, partial [Flavobacterium sp.]|nr:TonB-dependent receptor [Flavobacterium sp.]